MGWWEVVIILVAVGASYYSAQRQGNREPVKPGTFKVPTSTEGRKIGKLFGTRRIEDPNVVWYGDSRTEAIQK